MFSNFVDFVNENVSVKEKKLTARQLQWCEKNLKGSVYRPVNWKINSEGKVELISREANTGALYLGLQRLTRIPVQFVDTDYTIIIRGGDLKNLKSLEGLPKKCRGFVIMETKNLKNLVGGPEECAWFDMEHNSPIETLEGAPRVKNDFVCKTADLKGAPREVPRNFECEGYSLRSLEGGPEKVGGNYKFSHLSLENLKGIANEIGGDLSFHSCRNLKDISDLQHVKIEGKVSIHYCPNLEPVSAALVEDLELLNKWIRMYPRPTLREFAHDNRGVLLGKKFGF